MISDCAPKSHHYESWYLVAEVANELLSHVDTLPDSHDYSAILHWLQPLDEIIQWKLHAHDTHDLWRKLHDDLHNNAGAFIKLTQFLDSQQHNLPAVITEENKHQMRPLLQWLGAYLVSNVSEGIWYDELLRRVFARPQQQTALATVGGLRYPGDAERVRNAGGSILQIDRPSSQAQDISDPTESSRLHIVPDAIIINNGSLQDLKTCAEQVYADLQTRTLQPHYIARTDT